ncbi:MAG: S8 family serine peptidase [Myxococcota bacterium]
MPQNHVLPLTNPECSSISLILSAALGQQPIETLNTVFDGMLPEGWSVSRSNDARPQFIDLLAPLLADGRATIAPGDAWTLSRALAALEDVESAEPAFSVVDIDDSSITPPEEPTSEQDVSFGINVQQTADDDEYDWSLQLIGAEGAWEHSLELNRTAYGEGILVGHPDSGYRKHSELDDKLRLDLAWDFVQQDNNPKNSEGAHGLGTGSVILSADNRASKPKSVTGVAPKAELVPLRVTYKQLIHSSVLFRNGMERLRDAIWHSIDKQCHVISISLGWLKHSHVHAAIQEAVEKNIIVVAAASNYTWRLVSWPGAYPEVLCIAGCNARRKVWRGSARGPQVDFTGPAARVWKAVRKDGEETVDQGSGTSLATATTAGIAALWLAHHGRDALIERYKAQNGLPQIPLSEVFRAVLKASCTPPPRDDGLWGAGIVHAEGCLKSPLPSHASFFTGSYGAPSEKPFIDRVKDTLGADLTEPRLEALLRAPVSSAAGFEDELLFHLITDPEARQWMQQDIPGTGFSGDPSSPPALNNLSVGFQAALSQSE